MTRRLVLASASPARLALLRSAGLRPEVVVSGVSEDGVELLDVASAVVTLARRKALAVAGGVGDALVIGCDSLFELDGEVHGKPASPDAAVAQWRHMRGRHGRLHTGHCLIDTALGDRNAAGVATTIVRFGAPSDAEIDAYIATGEPLAVAGGFTLDGRAAPFIDGIEGDASNVLGLSLPLFRHLLAELGTELTDLWH
jgi:septum formation protein